MPNTKSTHLLLLPLDDDNRSGPADVPNIVGGLLSQSHLPMFSYCQSVGCVGNSVPLFGRIRCTERAVKIFWFGRTTGTGFKRLQQISEPPDDALWAGMSCCAVLAHSGRSDRTGHWFTFIKKNGVWWRSDTSLISLRQENPVLTQLLASNPPSSSDFTLGILMFK